MSELTTGSAVYNGGNSFTVKNSKITTRYAVPQEVGIVYKTSDSLSVSRPVADASGWTRKSSSVSVGLNESASFDSVIPLNSTTGYTHYAAYVKTSNGYWYGDVKSMSNDVQGDEGACQITNADVIVLNENEAVLTFSVNNISSSIDENAFNFIVYSSKNGNSESYFLGKSLNSFEHYTHSGSRDGEKIISVVLDSLTEDSVYNLGIRVSDIDGKHSNALSVSINTKNMFSITLSDKTKDYYSYNQYHVNFSSKDFMVDSGGSRVLNNDNLELYTKYYNGVSYLCVRGDADYSQVRVLLHCVYYIGGNQPHYFDREITLY